MANFNLLNPDEESQIPLKKTRETLAIVGKGTEKEFQRLLRMIELDFPEIHVLYKRMSPAKLFIMVGDPKENVIAER